MKFIIWWLYTTVLTLGAFAAVGVVALVVVAAMAAVALRLPKNAS